MHTFPRVHWRTHYCTADPEELSYLLVHTDRAPVFHLSETEEPDTLLDICLIFFSKGVVILLFSFSWLAVLVVSWYSVTICRVGTTRR